MSWIIISLLVAIIDQVTKHIILQNMELGDKIPVIDGFFYITLHKNTGAAWGILQNARYFFLVLIPIVVAFIVYYMLKNKNRALRFSLSLILGGAVGNYIDRIVWGEVTDFLLFYIGSYEFPIFNAADIAITCGTVLLAIYILFIYKKPTGKKQDEAEYEQQK
ncbi:MAG: signal peptidase II [Acetivibrionales bacterium]|jgi:signal peptidase II